MNVEKKSNCEVYTYGVSPVEGDEKNNVGIQS